MRAITLLGKSSVLCALASLALLGPACGGSSKSGGSSDKCANVTCTASDVCHVAGTCSPDTGQCSTETAKSCGPGLGCDVTNGQCKDLCAGTTCTATDQCHDVGTCDSTTGHCSNPIKTPGTFCNDGNGCTTEDKCDAQGACVGTTVTCLTPQDSQCQVLVGTCAPTGTDTYTCSYTAEPDTASCNADSNGCTGTTAAPDHCVSGVCTAGAAVVCTTTDPCKEQSGTCVSSGNTTHSCTFANKPDGTACNDGDACTGYAGAPQQDHCQSGQCAAGTTAVCQPSDQCHLAGTCSQTTGACSNPIANQGTHCNADSNGCTQNDACNATGTCVSGTAVTCSTPPNTACYAATGTCGSTGNDTFNCNYTAKPVDTACTPGATYNHCFASYACDATQTCAAVTSSAVSCTAGQCATAGTCDPADGNCKGGSNKLDGTACDDNNPCTGTTDVLDQCVGGACQSGAPVCDLGQVCDAGVCHKTGVQMDAVRDLQITTPGAMATDSSGASYVVSGIASTVAVDFDGHPVASFGDTDIFAAKYDPATHLALWATHYGDAANPQLGTGVAVTQDGTVAMIGNFIGNMTFGSNALSASSTLDFLAAVKGSDGTGKWGKAFNDGSNGKLSAVAANPSSTTNRIAVCGNASQASDLVPSSTFGGGTTDAVVAWFASDGTPVKAFELGGTGNETCNAAAVDDAGNVYFAGQFDGATLTIGSFTLTGPGTTSRKFIWVAKFDGTTGAALAAAAFSSVSVGSATPNSLAIDASGRLVMGGQFTSTLVFGATSLTSAGGADAFVAKLDPAASMTPIWAVRLGGTGTDAMGSVAVTSYGDVVAAGYFNRTTTGAAALTASTTSAPDTFILKLNGATGATDFSGGYGSDGTQTGDVVTVNRFGINQVAVLGTLNNTITFAPVDPVSAAGGTDVFLAMGHLFSM